MLKSVLCLLCLEYWRNYPIRKINSILALERILSWYVTECSLTFGKKTLITRSLSRIIFGKIMLYNFFSYQSPYYYALIHIFYLWCWTIFGKIMLYYFFSYQCPYYYAPIHIFYLWFWTSRNPIKIEVLKMPFYIHINRRCDNN